MSRGFNLAGSGRSRTLSGGLEAGALEIPRRFFGLARKIEGGGSVTILATVLVDTGSRLDQVIFEEFKGTGNCEIVLDRALAEARIFPAINLSASGTRKEDRLYSADDSRRLARLRRMLAGRKPHEAINLLFQLLERYPSNEELLQSIPLEP
jgi:transcription termination factor Rho